MQMWPWLAVGLVLLRPLSLAAEQAPVADPQWQVARAQFTSGIKNREPIDRLVVATPRVSSVYFFTDLRHLGGRTVTHRWMYRGRLESLVPFKVGGPRWRVYSRKDIEPDQVGEWSVTVVDESGWPLYTEMFRFADGAPLLLPALSGGSRQGVGTGAASGGVGGSVLSAPSANGLSPAPLGAR